ncbi:MAG: class I SAM-dependent methyltransferase [Nitrospirae bacterium]|nr:class I SAM-dependent methyltransferase [Nitrospirota bacterium]
MNEKREAIDGIIGFYNKSGCCSMTEAYLKTDRMLKLKCEVLNFINNKPSLNILDIGTGNGEFIYRLSNQCPQHHFFGCDISEDIIQQNIIEKTTVKWSVENINTRTSYSNDYFDIVIAGEVIEHMYDTDSFILEIKRILKIKGLLFISTPNLSSWIDRLTLLLGWQPLSTEVSNVHRAFGREGFYKMLRVSGDSQSAGHLRCFSRGALYSFLKYYKFNVIKDIPCHLHNFLINRIITRVFPRLSQQMLLIAVREF